MRVIIAKMATVISLVSTKGGVGKTVSAVHLAAYFSGFGPTLLVDGDATRSSTLWAKPGKLPFKVIPERALSMELSKTRYQFLFLDTEANPTDTDLAELAQGSTLAIIPTGPDALGLHSVLQTADKLKRFAPKTPFKALITIVPPRPNRDGEEAAAFLDEQRIPRFRGSIRRLAAFQRAVMRGTTVANLDRTNLGWQDYITVGNEIQSTLSLRVSA
jgi:chromosome partitioning protein